MTGGVVLPGNTYRKDSSWGKDVAIVITSLTQHYPLEPSCLNTHTPCPEKEVAPVQGLLLALCSIVSLAWAAVTQAMLTIMCLMMTASQADPPSASTCTLLRTTMMDISIVPTRTILFLPPLLLQKQRRVSVPPNRESPQQRKILVSHLVSLFQIGNLIVWLIVMLN